MKRVFVLGLVLACVLAVVGSGVFSSLYGGRELSASSRENSQLIPMPVGVADTFTFETAEGWVTSMDYKEVSASCWVWDGEAGPPFPEPALMIQQLHNRYAEKRYTTRDIGSPVPVLSYEELLLAKGGGYRVAKEKGFVLLPERIIGGERAVGIGYRSDEPDKHTVKQEYYVIRRDGLWTFMLYSGVQRPFIDPDTYRVLDTFRWIESGDGASASASPSAEES